MAGQAAENGVSGFNRKHKASGLQTVQTGNRCGPVPFAGGRFDLSASGIKFCGGRSPPAGKRHLLQSGCKGCSLRKSGGGFLTHGRPPFH